MTLHGDTLPTGSLTAPSAIPPRSGFEDVPTRIRDVRATRVPPLVVEPLSARDDGAIRQMLGELGARFADLHHTAAEAWLSHGCYEQALPHLEAAATFSPGDAGYHTQLGVVRYATGDDAGAINAFNAALVLDRGNADAWFDMGMVLFGQSQFAEAEDCFRRSSESQPVDSQTWNNRGVCLWQMQRLADAKVCFEQALKIDPNDRDAAFNLQRLC
jgi:Flp pilus assembly protein TadD